MIRVPWKLIARSVTGRPILSGLTVVTFALAVLILTAGQMVYRGVHATFEQAGVDPDRIVVLGRSSTSEVQSTIRPEQAGVIEAAIVQVLKGASAPVSKESVIVLSMARSDSSKRLAVAVRGLPVDPLPTFRGVQLASGRLPQPGLEEVLVGASLVDRIEGGRVGGKVRIGPSLWTVVGTIQRRGDTVDSEIWCDVDVLNSDALHGPLFSSVRAVVPAGTAFTALKTSLEGDSRLSVTVWREADYHRRLSRSLSTFVRVFGIGAASMFAVTAGLGLCALVWASAPWRRRDHGLMMALGFRRSDIIGSVLFEQLLLGLLGVAVGMALALLLQLVPFIGYSGETFSEAAFSLRVAPAMAGISAAFVVAVALLASALASLRLADSAPAVAMRAG